MIRVKFVCNIDYFLTINYNFIVMKAGRNKTIDITVEEGKKYLERCVRITSPCAVGDILNKTVLGDTFETIGFLPDKFIDLLIVDPPYNLEKNFGGDIFRKMDDSKYIAYTKSWLEPLIPKLKDTASVYVCCDWKTSVLIASVLKDSLYIRNRITWQREKGRGARSNWKNGMEDIWFCTVSEDYVFNVDAVRMRRRVLAPYRKDGKPKDWSETAEGKFRDTCPSNFWDDISVPYWSMPENTAHPTQKPEKLLAKLILARSNPGDIVFDPFAGSGSTLVTAKKLKRKYCGIEISERYCVWAEKRLENAEKDDAIQGFSDGVFWERNTNAFRKNK